MNGIAIYPGSFDPLTLGHIDIIARASNLFDRLIVGIGINPSKEPFLHIADRLQNIEQAISEFPNVSVDTFDGLLVDFARRNESSVIVRGLRAVSDYEYEFRVASANRKLAPEIETVMLITKDEFSFLASSVVREVALLGGDYDRFVPSFVADTIRRRVETIDKRV